MKVGIIIHSETGNTDSVAQKLKEKLSEAGHMATIERLSVVGKARPGMKEVQFETLPDISQYDALVFGSPVQAFALSSAMKCYLEQIGSLQDRKVALLITQFFPYPWMGGNQAVGKMKSICAEKGAAICGSSIINWSSRRRDAKIFDDVDRLGSLF